MIWSQIPNKSLNNQEILLLNKLSTIISLSIILKVLKLLRANQSTHNKPWRPIMSLYQLSYRILPSMECNPIFQCVQASILTFLIFSMVAIIRWTDRKFKQVFKSLKLSQLHQQNWKKYILTVLGLFNWEWDKKWPAADSSIYRK